MWISYAAALVIPSVRDTLLLSEEGKKVLSPMVVAVIQNQAVAFAFCGVGYLVANNDASRRALFRVNVFVALAFAWLLYGSPFFASFGSNTFLAAQPFLIGVLAAKFGFA